MNNDQNKNFNNNVTPSNLNNNQNNYNQNYQNNYNQNYQNNYNQNYQNNGYVSNNYRNLAKNNNGYIGGNVPNNLNNNLNKSVTYNSTNNQQGNNVGSYTSNVNRIIKSLDNNVDTGISKKRADKIFFFFLVFIILASILIYFVFFRKDGSTYADLDSVFDTNKPVLIFDKNNKFGYVDKNGKVIVEPSYYNATQFYGDYAGVVFEEGKEEYAIIDLKGKEVILKKGGEEPQYIIDYDIWVIGDAFYDGNMKRISPDNIAVTYDDNGYFTFKDSSNKQSGIIDYKGEIIYTIFGTEGVELEMSHSDYDVDEYFVKVTNNESVFVVSTKTDDLVYTYSGQSELHAGKNNFFYTYQDNGKKDFLYFYNGALRIEVYSVDEMHIADYKNQIIFAKLYNQERYYDILNETELQQGPEKNEYYSSLYGTNDYDFEVFDCGDSKGLVDGDKILVSCDYSTVNLLDINLFSYVKKKTLKQIVLLEKNSSIIVYDMAKKKELKTFKNVEFKTYDNSVLVRFAKYDGDDPLPSGYIVYNLLTDQYVEINAEELSVDIYPSYYIVSNRGIRSYYNADFEKIYEVSR